jgi:hypothetical protein
LRGQLKPNGFAPLPFPGISPGYPLPVVILMFPGDLLNQFLRDHVFQPDYWQFYIIVAMGFIYFEIRFRKLMKKTSFD